MSGKAKNEELTKEKITTTLLYLNTREDNVNGEEWKHYVLGYFVSNMGRLWNECTKSDIKPYPNHITNTKKEQKHLCFKIHLNGRNRKCFVHKVVYYCFGKHKDKVLYSFDTEKNDSNLVVHHIDSNPLNNNINNLYLMPKKWHTKLTMQLVHGKIKQTDVDSAEKINEWLLLHTDVLIWFTDEE